jgi:hypothetical protein
MLALETRENGDDEGNTVLGSRQRYQNQMIRMRKQEKDMQQKNSRKEKKP